MDPNEMAIAVGKTFVWHEVYVADSQKAVDFYTNALGWGTQAYDMGPMGAYHTLVANGQAVAGIMATAGVPELENVPPHWSTYVGVDDVDARMAKCVELGAKVLHGPMDIPNVGRMVLIEDPQGAVFWLFKGAS